MNKRCALVLQLAFAAGCGGASGGGTTASPTVDTGHAMNAPPATAMPSPPATAEPATPAMTATPAASAPTCQPFCHWIGSACRRPAATTAELLHITPSKGHDLAQTDGRTGPHEDCAANCCPAQSNGPDPDGDGITVDRCPDAPEDADGFEDHDGCPELDNDGDGWDDLRDRCYLVAEDKDGFEDKDGCPE